jgi:putative ABC transport system permease protein
MRENIASAFRSIWSHKVRSLLTLFGVVIGVSSVTTLIALGQGLKSDVASLIQGFGTNVVIVIPGAVSPTGGQGNPADSLKGDILTVEDVQDISALQDITHAVPMSLVSGSLRSDHSQAVSQVIAGSYPTVLQAFQTVPLETGRMFTSQDEAVIVLGVETASQLFPDQEALGRVVTITQTPFTVVGVLGKSKTASALATSYDTMSFIPFNQATALNKGVPAIHRIIVKVSDSADVTSTKQQVTDLLRVNHRGELNFSVLTQDDLLGLFDQFLTMATAMVSAIAGISLVVGGIGIMNIMLVTVTERTREIGLRKALGATRKAIALQFLTESIAITVLGGLIGLAISMAVGLAISSKTPLQPQFTADILLITLAISLCIGSIFGLWPALHAAKKDPAESLRYE